MIEEVFGRTIKLFPIIKKVLNKRNSLRHIFYHRVNAEINDYFFNPGITPTIFEQQILELSRTFKFISLQEALKMEDEEFDNHICISFDDGFRECYDIIVPILNKYGIKATFFLIENSINNEDMMWRNKLITIQNLAQNSLPHIRDSFYENYKITLEEDILKSSRNWNTNNKDDMANFIWNESKIGTLESYLYKEKPYLSEKEIKALISDGHQIGSHSKTHPFCNTLTKKEIDDEIIGSSKRISERFSYDCNFFSYPFGASLNKENSNYVLENSNLVNLLGIHDSLANTKNNQFWQRVEMESTLNKSYWDFYAIPRIRKIIKK